MIQKILNFKFVIYNCNKGMTRSIFTQNHPEYTRGMTYVELIVVLSIFSVMSAVVLFNYQKFQAKVDIKSLTNDIALKFVEAQRASTSGKLPPVLQPPTDPATWKPSYGLHFDLNVDNKKFYYFADLDQNSLYLNPSPLTCPVGECLEEIIITKGNTVSNIEVFYQDLDLPMSDTIDNVTVSYRRPNSGANIKFTPSSSRPIDYVELTVSSPPSTDVNTLIKIYSSGRIQLN